MLLVRIVGSWLFISWFPLRFPFGTLLDDRSVIGQTVSQHMDNYRTDRAPVGSVRWTGLGTWEPPKIEASSYEYLISISPYFHELVDRIASLILYQCQC